jgi:hypothetical protein
MTLRFALVAKLQWLPAVQHICKNSPNTPASGGDNGLFADRSQGFEALAPAAPYST